MRPCAVCGKDQKNKKVMEKYNDAVICLTCGAAWTFDGAGKPVAFTPKLTKTALIRQIVELQGDMANPAYLRTRTLAQLEETLARSRAITNVTDAEIHLHSDMGFIR